MSRSISRIWDAYRAQNLAAAGIILGDPERHGGEESLAVRWARLVVEHEENKA